MTLAYLNEQITTALDNGLSTIGIFIEPQRAFDTIDYDILYEKKEFIGISGTALDWMESYLCARKQYVEYGKHCLWCPTGIYVGAIIVCISYE